MKVFWHTIRRVFVDKIHGPNTSARNSAYEANRFGEVQLLRAWLLAALFFQPRQNPSCPCGGLNAASACSHDNGRSAIRISGLHDFRWRDLLSVLTLRQKVVVIGLVKYGSQGE